MPMIRLASLLAVACMLSINAAQAQISNAELLTRIDRLEAALRDLTGTVEQLQYRNQQFEQQLQRLQASGGAPAAVPPRPTAQTVPPPPPYSPPPPAQYSPPPGPIIAAPPAAAPAEPDAATGRRGDAFNPALNPAAPGAPRPLGTSTNATEPPPPVAEPPGGARLPRQAGAPLDLGTLSGSQASAAPGGDLPPPPPANPSATGAVTATLPPGSSPKDEYDLAYGYVQHKDYAPAADTFRDFLHKYPSDRLAPEAQYWLGESLFQKQQYRDAAEAFLAVSTKYETTARAPDALLRLGQSLAALGEKEAACASLGEVLRKYPRASLSVKQNVEREQKRVHC
jgi:tol-pal system protein YbgF